MASVSMSTLTEKYDNFMVPAMAVVINGVNIVRESEFVVESVEVVLSEKAASSASVKLTNVYDLEERSFNKEIKSQIVLGEVIEIEMGYGSKLTTLFRGYVNEINYEISGTSSVDIVAVDVRRMMMEIKKSNMSYQGKSYSQIFEEVMKKYKVLYKQKSVDADTAQEEIRVTQNGSDYDFVVKELCRKANREFYVQADTVYFKETLEELFQTVELEWEKDISSFRRCSPYQDVVIRVIGQNVKSKESVEAEVTVKSDDKQKTLVKSEKEEIIGDIQSRDAAKKIAEYKAKQYKKETRRASGECIGIPEIKPGGQVKIKNGDKDLVTGVYDVIEVRHMFASDGYRTSFDIGGWKR